MSQYTPPVSDMRFVLHDVLDVTALYKTLPAHQDTGMDLIDPVLEEAARFNAQVLAPTNKPGDQEGCHFADGVVTTPKGFREAYQQFVESGWTSLCGSPKYGGQGLPESIGAAFKEMIDSANLSWGTYPLLSHGASDALMHHGEEWQREVFLPHIINGDWTGTMCLTEPHCGSDLGMLKTRAEPTENGTYKLYGTKIFITGGEHDLTENIVHLVLARLPDAPAGTRGISMFIVPKFKVDREGNQGERNAVTCGSIEHKMGIRGSATCVMNFDGAEGYLIGAENRGLMAMFTMMNSARVAVGIQGLALIESSYQGALAYARDRLQMRSLSGPKYPDKPADPIIVHADVRRMLLTMKAFAEGGRAMAYHAGTLVDIVHSHPDEAERKRADDLLGFMTPIVKALLTEAAIECTSHGVQILGGHGYIAEWGMEQYLRDARITTIYEGTTQIQALDLLGRKIMQLQGSGLRQFIEIVQQFISENQDNAVLAEFLPPLGAMLKEWQEITLEIGKKAAANPEEIGAAAVDYLYYSGYVCLAYWWARMVAASKEGSDRRSSKLHTARFFYQRILPRTRSHLDSMRSGPDNLLQMPEELFATQ